ncbi:heterokaryon incompatibility protein-domain-containing protein [Hyaloscypha finlandica]|nr:heterokaryon incompatibility protein-domain-containing protein [Hyaloscypha finlandica]
MSSLYSTQNTYTQMRLCENCSSINFDELLFTRPGFSRDNWCCDNARDTFIGTLSKIIDGSERCDVCYLVLVNIFRVWPGLRRDRVKMADTKFWFTPREFFSIEEHPDGFTQSDSKSIVRANRLQMDISVCGGTSTREYAANPEFQALCTRSGEVLPGTGRLMTPRVDLGKIKSWVRTCVRKHGSACSKPAWVDSSVRHRPLRLIDVRNRCVVLSAPDHRYLALSYTWGSESRKNAIPRCLTKANVQSLSAKGGLDNLDVPATIRDAMTVIEAVGEWYLWVDAFCIVQDDVKELMDQVAQMDSIYAGAFATIVAAAGSDADAGLPGVRDNRAFSQQSALIGKGLSLVSVASTDNLGRVDRTYWNNRGWTYQERLLSRRNMIFTEAIVYWNCPTTFWDEETHLEQEGSKYSLAKVAFGSNDVWDGRFDFRSNVIGYSAREFTYDEDVLPGFLGVLNRLRFELNLEFHWGLPSPYLGYALLWDRSGGWYRNKALCPAIPQLGIHKPVHYPTWSWSGWIGETWPEIRCDYEGGDPRHTWKQDLDFYCLLSNGDLRPILGKLSSLDQNGRKHDSTSTIDPTITSRLWRGDTLITETNIRNIKSSKGINSSKQTLDVQLEASITATPSDTGRLVFWTSYAKLPVWSESVRWFFQIDNQKRRIRDLTLDCYYEDKEEQEPESLCYDPTVGLEDGETSLQTRPKGLLTETRKQPTRKPDKCYLIHFVLVSSSYYPDKPEVEERKHVNLLVIKWNPEETDVARRIGYAEMLEQDWMAVDREWRVVVLE